MEDNEKVIYMKVNQKEEKIRRKAKVIGEISKKSAMSVLEDPSTYTYAAAIGLFQGLKYRGSISQGIKAGVATIGVFVGANVIQNIVNNRDEIKKA